MGWNGSEGTAAPQKPKVTANKPSPVRGIVAGLVVVAVVCVAYFVFFSGSEKPQTVKVEKDRGRIKEVTPAPAPKPKAEEPQEDPAEAAKRARREKLKAMTPDERLAFLFEEAKKREIPYDKATNQIFATGTEQVMSWVFTTEPGDIPPILPQIPMFDEAHMAEILISKNPPKEGDSEEVKAIKQTVEYAKEELIKYIKAGGEPQEFLKYYHDQLRQAHMEFQESRQSVFKVCREDPELALDYCAKVNERLAQKGIKPVKIPKPLAERNGIKLPD